MVCIHISSFFAAERFTTESHFGPVSSNFILDDVACIGSENSLFDCPHSTAENCDHSEGAGVVCTGKHFINSLWWIIIGT